MFGMLQIDYRIRGGRIISEINRLNLPSQSTILDAGFGHGVALFGLSRLYPKYKFVGFELDENSMNNSLNIQKVIKRNNVTLSQTNLVEINGKNCFDLIYSCDVLEHIDDDIKVLKNFQRSLKTNGILILHLPLKYEFCRRILPWLKKYTTEDHVRDEYTPEEIISKLEKTGFSLLSFDYGYGLMKGELSFELNNLFIHYKGLSRLLFIFTQLFFFPLSLILGYLDIKYPPKFGISLVIKAAPIKSQSNDSP